MKIHEKDVFFDVCHTSIEFLKNRCRSFFEKNSIPGPIWFVDEVAPFESFPANNEVVNVVFFGNFFKRFFESGNWPFARMRFWCLSSVVKEAMSTLFHIDSSYISVIPRNDLVASSLSITPSGLGKTWIYAGRISATKNIEMLLLTVNALQTIYQYPIQLYLFGEYDDATHAESGRWSGVEYDKIISGILEEYEWIKKPQIIHGKGPNEWFRGDFDQPVFVSLSTFLCEDFAVSLAQSQALGWPSIVSDWGAHQEGIGYIHPVHPARIGQSHEHFSMIQLKSRALAKYFHQNASGWKLKTKPNSSDLTLPATMEVSFLDTLRRNFIIEWGPDIQHIYREGLDAFSYTPIGQRFFDIYGCLFSGVTPSIPQLVLTTNFYAHEQDAKLILDYCNDFVGESLQDLLFFPLNESLSLKHLTLLHQAKEIIIPFYSPNLAKHVSSWSKLGVSASIKIFTAKADFEKAVSELTPYLKIHDGIEIRIS